jgi:hypothetical protein
MELFVGDFYEEFQFFFGLDNFNDHFCEDLHAFLHNFIHNFNQAVHLLIFLSAFAYLWEVPVSFNMSVCHPSAHMSGWLLLNRFL